MRVEKILGLTWKNGRNDLNGATPVTDDTDDFVFQLHRVVPVCAVYFVLKLLDALHRGPFPVAFLLLVSIPLLLCSNAYFKTPVALMRTWPVSKNASSGLSLG